MEVFKANHRFGSLKFYVRDREFGRIAKVWWNKDTNQKFVTVAKTINREAVEESSPLELLIITGLDKSELKKVLDRMPR